MSDVVLSRDHCIQHMQASKQRLEDTLTRIKAALGEGRISAHYQQIEMQHQVVCSLIHHLQDMPKQDPADYSKVLKAGCTGAQLQN